MHMNTSRFLVNAAHSGACTVARVILLIIGLSGGPLLATQAIGTNDSAHMIKPRPLPQVSHADGGCASSPSRINGRVDWDTDYPSQLAPEALEQPQARDTVATAAGLACAVLRSYAR